MSRTVPAVRVLHVRPAEDAQSWAAQVAGFIGLHNKGLAHWMVCPEWDVWQQSAAKLSKAIKVSQPLGFPHLGGKSGVRALQALAQAMRSYDLILTYGEGALQAALAHALFGPGLGLGPLVHHLDPEGTRSGLWRNWYRMIALSRASAVIAPSRAVAEQALHQWRQPAGKVHYVPHGIDTAACRTKPKPNALPRVVKRDGELWIGTCGGSGAGLTGLLSALPSLGDQWQLVVLEQVSHRDAVLAEAMRLEVGHRVHLPGAVEDIVSVIGLFDLFAVPDGATDAQTAQVIKQAMAAGLAVIGSESAGLRELLSAENAGLIGQADALASLTQDPALRREIGDANRAFAKASFDLTITTAQQAAIYARALGRGGLSA